MKKCIKDYSKRWNFRVFHCGFRFELNFQSFPSRRTQINRSTNDGREYHKIMMRRFWWGSDDLDSFPFWKFSWCADTALWSVYGSDSDSSWGLLDVINVISSSPTRLRTDKPLRFINKSDSPWQSFDLRSCLTTAKVGIKIKSNATRRSSCEERKVKKEHKPGECKRITKIVCECSVYSES